MPSLPNLEALKLRNMLKIILSFYRQFFFQGIGYGLLINIPAFIYVAIYGISSLNNYNNFKGFQLFTTLFISFFLLSLSFFSSISKATSQLYLVQPVNWNFANKSAIYNAWRFSGAFFVSLFWSVLKPMLSFTLSYFGPDLIAYCLGQYHGRCVTRPQLLEQLHGFDVDISSGKGTYQ